jgi:hypothetical protein
MASELSNITFTDQDDIVPRLGWSEYSIQVSLILLLATTQSLALGSHTSITTQGDRHFQLRHVEYGRG